ncbi:hypothetical protein ACHAPC_009894, partial [Botrytis cinerea]|uniref:Putative ankyrin repeat protein n=1 Tax=Botryotinia fuckeliana (strain BcDW1) TaxID=1290391 RepID=M7TQF8_BOTF1|nr:putative ankyrin repeat protein [Botrytis cinerea BcDW1]
MASSYDPLPVNEREQNYSVETYSTPTSPAQFLSLLSRFPRKSTRELVKPYLLYETWLRKAFAKPHAVVGGPEDLASIYDGHESSFKIRTIDRETTAAEKYIMPLKEREEELGGQLAIAGSLEIFRENFNAFTHGILDGINWSNIVVAGSAALLPLLSPRRDEGPSSSAAVGPPLENYFDNIAKASDIDIFIYGINDEKLAIWRISEIEATIRKNQRIVMGEGLSLHTKNAITFIAPRYPHRHVQIILRLYDSITEILTGFDVDSYENRLFKYRQHKFDVFWEPLDRSQIKKLGPNYMQLWEMKGLARLLLFESNIKREYTGPYDEPNPKNLKRIDEARDPVLMTEDHYHSSGYTGIEIPHHIIFTADKIHDFVRKNAKEPFKFGTLNEILYQESAGRETAKVSPTLKFIKEDCGRQMIGSFYPYTTDDWTAMAYGGLEESEESSSSGSSLPGSRSRRRLVKQWAREWVARTNYWGRHWKSDLKSKIRAIAHSTRKWKA